jgi:hypothetical protein
MAEGVVSFRRKPERPGDEWQLAAKYDPDSGPVAYALAQVASEASDLSDPPALAEAVFLDSSRVLVVRWLRVGDLGNRTEHLVIRPGHWLAYDPAEGFLYEASDGNWDQFYDRQG